MTFVSFAALGITLATGRFDAGAFFEGLPAYFNVVAVLPGSGATSRTSVWAEGPSRLARVLNAITERFVEQGADMIRV
jgi:hypothetical protein